MPGKSIKIGPWKKGLNNISTAGECEDDEAVKLVNFEVALDSSLTCRPPIEVVNGSLLNSAYSSLYTVFGIYRVSATEWYVIAQYQTGANQWTLAAILNGDPTSTILTINTFTSLSDVATCFAQWTDTCYFNTAVGAANVGFHWKKGDAGVTLCNQANYTMPHGNILVAWKSRLWTVDTQTVLNANVVAYSYIDGTTGSHPDQWRCNGNSATGFTATTDTFQVEPGFGGYLTCMLPLANSMLIFKSDSTYRFAYASDPSKGEVDRLSDYIGCSNQFSAVNFENYVYLLHQGRVYELINNLFIQINKLVYFQPDGDNEVVDAAAPTVSMSAVSRRILIQYNNTMFIYGIDTKTWSQWRSNSGTPGRFYLLPQDPASANPLQYIAASQGTTQNPSTNYITDQTSAAVVAYMENSVPAGYGVQLYTDSHMPSGQGLGVTTASPAPTNNLVWYFNQTGINANPAGYNIPCGQGMTFTVAGNYWQSSAFTVNATLNCLLRNGSTTTVNVALPAGNVGNYTAFSVNLVTPANTILAYLTFTTPSPMPANSTLEFDSGSVSIKRANVQSAISLLKLTDHHYSSTASVEYIECILNTKSYDYQAPANVKRLFWWGIDCVTKRDINVVCVPIAQTQPPLWGDLQNYTWAQLQQGTWGNPLVWRGQQLNVIDSASVANSMTANGRAFVKNNKSLRFRQIQFNVTMTSLGNTSTGPCKLFGLVTYALPHEKESAKVS